MIKLEFCQSTHHAGSFAVSQPMGIFLLLWPQARCELNIEFNIFLAQFHEKMNFQNVSAGAI